VTPPFRGKDLNGDRFTEHLNIMVRAKFKCNGVTLQEGGGSSVSLSPVTSGSAENEAFYKLTPGGNIALSTINDETAQQFVEGKEYYVDFSVVEEVAVEAVAAAE
jgi:hypothetical protein